MQETPFTAMTHFFKKHGCRTVLVFAIAAFLISVPALVVQAQNPTVVAEVNYDDQQPGYSFGLAYGGYRLKGSDQTTSMSDMISFSTKTIVTGGNGGAAIAISLDKSKLELPKDDQLDYAYLAVGVGVNGRSKIGPLKEIDLSQYAVSFDAKIINGRTMEQSHAEIVFVTADGQGPVADDDENDDQLCKLSYAGSQSDDEIKLTNEFQSFKIELADMSITEGSLADVEKCEATGIVLIVVAEDSPKNFENENETKLIVDNFRFFKK